MEAEGYRYRILERLTQVLRVKTDVDAIRSVASRSAMTRVCGQELFNCHANAAEIIQKMRKASFENLIEKGESFVVRVKRIRGCSPHIASEDLERKLGGLILDRVKGVRVNLTRPQKTFLGVLTEDKFVFGLKIVEVSPKPFLERKPRKRPFFHPTAMPAKLARCMVNLAQPRAGDLVLDAFCGTASILIEAGLIGCRVVGFDARRRMAEGSLRNLVGYSVDAEGLVVADARRPPISRVDCVVTDPPYGRSATTLGWGTQQIVEDFLSTIEDRLPKGRRICMASPKSIGISRIGKEIGFKHVESHHVYVHRSLTREIAVFERI